MRSVRLLGPVSVLLLGVTFASAAALGQSPPQPGPPAAADADIPEACKSGARCVKSIQLVDPAGVRVTPNGDGVRLDWDTSALRTEPLPSPVTFKEARRIAKERARARGFEYGTPNGPPPAAQLAAQRARKGRVRGAGYGGFCFHTAGIGVSPKAGSLYGIHAVSTDTCVNNSWHHVYTELHVGSARLFKANDEAWGFGAGSIATDALKHCYYSSSAHNWWNYSDFAVWTAEGRYIQGPSGYFVARSVHCL